MKYLKFLLPLLFISTNALAAELTISGVENNGSSITLTGESFGTGTTPLVWENFEEGTDGQLLSETGWTAYGASDGAIYSDTQSYGQGSISAHNAVGDNGRTDFATSYKHLSVTGEIYVSYMFRFDLDGTDKRGNMKHLRIGSNGDTASENGYSGEGVIKTEYDYYNSWNRFYYNYTYDDYYTQTILDEVDGQWHRIEMYAKISDPGTANGSLWVSEDYNIYKNNIGDIVTVGEGESFQWYTVLLGLMMPNTYAGNTWYLYNDDIYISSSRARVEIGDNADFNSCTHREIQIPMTWSSTEIEIDLNIGSFSPGDTVYIFVIDENENASAGYEYTIPYISSATRTGDAITVTGGWFGPKETAAPLLWETFDDGDSGTSLTNSGHWTLLNGVGGYYDNQQSYSGNLAAYNYVSTEGDGYHAFNTSYTQFDPTDELYVTHKYYYTHTGGGYGIIKNTRLTSSAAAGGGGIYDGKGESSFTNLNPYYPPFRGYVYYETDVGEKSLGYIYSAEDRWVTHEFYKKMSTPGVEDGVVWCKNLSISSALSASAVTRPTGETYQHDTVLLGLMCPNIGSVGATPASVSMWIDDVYIDNTQARVMLGNTNDINTCTILEPQPPTAWSDTSITATFNQGSFSDGDTMYAFVFDEDGNVSEALTISDTTPEISAVSGTAAQGNSLTITVSNAGIKDPCTPLAFEDFRNGVDDLTIEGNQMVIGGEHVDGGTSTSRPLYEADYPEPWDNQSFVAYHKFDNTSCNLKYPNESMSSDEVYFLCDAYISTENAYSGVNLKLTYNNTEYGSHHAFLVPGGGTEWGFYKNYNPITIYKFNASVETFQTTVNYWKTYECYYKLDQPDYEADDGTVKIWIDGYLGKDTVGEANLTSVSESTTNIYVGGYFDIRDYPVLSEKSMYFSQVVVDNDMARVMLGDAATLNDCTTVRYQLCSAWSDGSVTFTLDKGRITGSIGYLYLFDSNGNVNEAGYPVIFESTYSENTTLSGGFIISGGLILE